MAHRSAGYPGRIRTRHALVAAGLALASLSLAACGSDDDGTPTGSNPAPGTNPAPGASNGTMVPGGVGASTTNTGQQGNSGTTFVPGAGTAP